jgi:hypothetical protein
MPCAVLYYIWPRIGTARMHLSSARQWCSMPRLLVAARPGPGCGSRAVGRKAARLPRPSRLFSSHSNGKNTRRGHRSAGRQGSVIRSAGPPFGRAPGLRYKERRALLEGDSFERIWHPQHFSAHLFLRMFARRAARRVLGWPRRHARAFLVGI